MSLAIVVVCCFLFIIFPADGQSVVTIHLPEGETPNENHAFYEIQCTITNFRTSPFQSIAWFFNGQIIIWGERIVFPGERGRMSIENGTSNNTFNSYLIIIEVTLDDTGSFQCSRVEGDPNNYIVKASAAETIIVNTWIPPGQYFPPAPWPICYPSVDINVLLGSEAVIGCVSQKGNPPVGIHMFLDHEMNNLPQQGTILDRGFALNKEVSFNVLPENNNDRYMCQIMVNSYGSIPSMMSSCITGKIIVGLIEQKIVQLPEGASDAFFACYKPADATIIWSTEPYIPPNRMAIVDSSASSFIQIKDLNVNDNNTIVKCRIEQYGLQDEGKIIVLASRPRIPTTTLTIEPRPGEQYTNASRQITSHQVKLFHERMPYVAEGNDAVFNCTSGLHTDIAWSSDPPIEPSRVTEIEPNLLRITNVRLSDNGTNVICRVLVGNQTAELQGSAIILFVYIPGDFTTETATTTTTPSFPSGLIVGVGIGAFFLGIVVCFLVVLVVHRKVKCKQLEDRNIQTFSRPNTGNVNAAGATDNINDASYMGLNLSDVQDSSYTSLKVNASPCDDATETTRDYINMDRREDGTGITNATGTAEGNDGAYTGLNLSEVDKSNYTDLKINRSPSDSVAHTNHDYINVASNGDDTMYEVTLSER